MSDPGPPVSEGDPAAPQTPAKPARLRFPRAARLTRATEFRRVREKGRSYPGRFLVLGVLVDAHADGQDSRIGLVTSRRVGNAVVRNYVRRLLREAVRHTRLQLRAGCWLVIVARYTASRATAAELDAEWRKLARKAGTVADPDARAATTMINRFLRGLIRAYQLTLSPLLSALDVIGGGCRFEPTCSRYCMQALAEHGTARGLWLGAKRLARCAPWGGMGYDPVPPRRGKFAVPPAPPVMEDEPRG